MQSALKRRSPLSAVVLAELKRLADCVDSLPPRVPPPPRDQVDYRVAASTGHKYPLFVCLQTVRIIEERVTLLALGLTLDDRDRVRPGRGNPQRLANPVKSSGCGEA
jgi:hypothetical protein